MLDNLLAPRIGVAAVVTDAAEQMCILFCEITKERWSSDCIGQCNSVLSSVFLNPRFKHTLIAVGWIELWIALSDCHDVFMRHSSNRCKSKFLCEKNV